VERGRRNATVTEAARCLAGAFSLRLAFLAKRAVSTVSIWRPLSAVLFSNTVSLALTCSSSHVRHRRPLSHRQHGCPAEHGGLRTFTASSVAETLGSGATLKRLQPRRRSRWPIA
jgi:hypothetical protein